MKTINFEEFYNKKSLEFKIEVDKLTNKLYKMTMKKRKIRLRRKRYKYIMKIINFERNI